MINHQYGSFKIESSSMRSILQSLQANTNKKFFIIVGDEGTGKSTMLSYVNKVIFNNSQAQSHHHLIDGVDITSGSANQDFKQNIESAIVTTTKESAHEIIKQFDKNQTHIIVMPSLNERKEDLVNFANFFIEVLSLMNNKMAATEKNKLTEKAIEKLLQHDWPGNFYELEFVLEKAFEKSLQKNIHDMIGPEHIDLNSQDRLRSQPQSQLQSQSQNRETEFSIGQKLDEIERKYILQTLYFVQQNRTKAAGILGISIRTLRNKISQYREEGHL